MICPHASPVPFTSIWKPYSTIRPITGIATRSWGLLRSSRSASARYAGSMAGKRRYSSTGTPRNTTGKHFVGIPPQGSRHSTTGYLNYRQVVQGIPTVGSSCTTQWYAPYLSKVQRVPKEEIIWYTCHKSADTPEQGNKPVSGKHIAGR